MPDSIYEKNIEAMRSRFPKIVDCIQKPGTDVEMIDEEKDLEVSVTDVCGKKVLVAQKGNETYQLDSLYDSDPMLDLWFKGLKDDWDLNSRLYMYGLGNGMFVRKFLEKARKDCAIVVHEPSYKILKAVLENYDMSDIFTDPRVRFVFWPIYIGNNIKSAYESIMSYTDIGSLAASNYPNYLKLFPNDLVAYVEGVERVKAFALANQTVNDNFGEYFCRNAFSNLHLLEGSYDIIKLAEHMPEDIPAIVVAAGPSLDKNIKEIAKAKGKCIIVSTDTALKPLSLAGIVPDITAIMDGKKDAKYLSEEDSRSVPIVCNLRGGTEFLHLHTGMKFFTSDLSIHVNGFLKSIGHGMYKLDGGGSVANACFSIAKLLKCKKIILVGQDLAYTGNKTHSAVTVRGEKKTKIEDLEHVEMGVDIYGDPIRTSREFLLYKEWFEQRINANKDLEVIDATEGGIKIEGTRIMKLSEAIEEFCTREYDVSGIIRQAPLLFDDEAKEKIREFARDIPDCFVKLRRIIRKTLSDYGAMRRLVLGNDYHNNRMKKIYEDCKKQTKEIENSPVIEYVQEQLQGKSTELLDKVNKLEKDEKQELLTVCDLGEQYLKDMDQAITELEPYIDIIRKDFG